MAKIVVLGAGLTGLAASSLLARDGHQVTVLERDSAEPLGDAEALWDSWQRPGVSQFRLPHVMQARWRATMEDELPDVLTEVERLGGLQVNPIDQLPAAFTGGPQAGDDDLRMVMARRPVIEGALAKVAARTPDVIVRRGVRATSLIRDAGPIDGVPHVAGVLTDSDEAVRADVVVDAMGRRSPLAGMLDAIGARRPIEEQEDLGFVYYARHFRTLGDGIAPPAFRLFHGEAMSLLVIPADARTFSVVLVIASNDHELRELRDERAWERVLTLFPDLTEACSASEPISPMQVMPGAEDRHLTFVHDGGPVATGVVAVGDAAIRTSPSVGRGTSIGLDHARVLRDVLREVDIERPEQLARRFAEATEAEITPLYRRTLAADRARMAEVQADIAGTPHPPAAPGWLLARTLTALAAQDASIMRAFRRTATHILETDTALDDPLVRARFEELTPIPLRYPSTMPTRAQVLAAIAAEVTSDAPVAG